MKQMKVVAISPRDGWCCVQEGSHYFLMRPPYDKPRQIDEIDVHSAIIKHGFFSANRQFDTRDEIIEFLQENIRQERPELEGMSSSDLGRRFIEVANMSDIREFLRFTAEEILPDKLPHAIDLLTDVLDRLKVMNDEE